MHWKTPFSSLFSINRNDPCDFNFNTSSMSTRGGTLGVTQSVKLKGLFVVIIVAVLSGDYFNSGPVIVGVHGNRGWSGGGGGGQRGGGGRRPVVVPQRWNNNNNNYNNRPIYSNNNRPQFLTIGQGQDQHQFGSESTNNNEEYTPISTLVSQAEKGQEHDLSSDDQDFDTNTPSGSSSSSGCPRPVFEDPNAALVVDNKCQRGLCLGDLDTRSTFPMGWRVVMVCAKGNVRIRQPTTCGRNGEWLTHLPKDCSPLYDKYIKTNNIVGGGHLASLLHSNSNLQPQTPKPSLNSSEHHLNILPVIDFNGRQCPMLQMRLSPNFLFSCYMSHGSGEETENCLSAARRVPAGTVAVLKCKPPFFSEQVSKWTCNGETGLWVGNFDHNLKCFYSPEKGTTEVPSTEVTTTTFTTTPSPSSSTTAIFEDNTILPSINPSARSCPMLQMKLAPNLIFSCFMHHQSSTETENCLNFRKVPAGTIGLLRCKPPFSPVNGTNKSRWVCDGRSGMWVGDFDHNLKCFYTTATPTPPSLSSTSQSTTTVTVPMTTTTIPITTPTSISTTTFTTSTFKSVSQCPKLEPLSEGMTLACISRIRVSPTSPSEQVLLSSCDTPQTNGTEARYTCNKYYEPTTSLLTTLYRRCGQDGEWLGGKGDLGIDGFNCVPECGRKNDVLVSYITFGTPTFRGQWPWHVAIFLHGDNDKSREYICGGTLVSSRTVVTAAHCVTFKQSTRVRNITQFSFDLGRHDLNEKEDDSAQSFSAESIHVHDSYTPFGYDSDIALVILKKKITVGHYVRPICFPQGLNSAQEEVMLSEGSTGTVVGWGVNENGTVTPSLQMAELKVVSQKECSAGTRRLAGGTIQVRSTTYCAAPGQNKDGKAVNVCSGDSGSGMYFPLASPSTSASGASTYERFYLQGLVSFGVADANNQCDPNQFSFFTRVGRYADWIVRVMSENDAL